LCGVLKSTSALADVLFVWDLSVCSHSTNRLFCVAFAKATAPRVVALAAQAIRRFLFAQLFLLGLFPQKKKRYKGELSFDTKAL
jgi:hypothetical protein